MQMTPDNWNRVKALFEAALTLEPSERAAFLGQSCPEADLRQQVEKLLSNYQEAGRFLSDPGLDPRLPTPRQMAEVGVAHESADFGAGSGVCVATVSSVEVEDAMVGRRIGAYKLVRRVGQGGMAAVYQAERADGEFQQQVAVKLVWPGMGKEEILGRFRRERQTLAGLDHTNIVKLLDGGSTAEGLPYLVMDYVEGSPIDEYCDQHKLGVEERLRLFVNVCGAVEYAHQKRVIHRDLKPSNILVTAEGVPKLLDFGIAKVLEPTGRALSVTQTSTRCMTPAYASPEQMRGRPTTTATDVYSLGVVLYELLTGHGPYRLKEYTPSEIERAICEQVPVPPSTAVSRMEPHHPPSPSSGRRGRTDHCPTPSSGRRGLDFALSTLRRGDGSADLSSKSMASPLDSVVEPRTRENLRRRLCGDLDNIVLKALEKEPQRRYPSPQELARDIERHLSHLPITARPPSLSYRAMKFVQRHKTNVSTAVMGILVLAGAAAIFGLNAFKARERLAGGTPSPQIQSLAVLPLANLSGDPAQEYFSDGMTDALITELAQIGSLRVISRTSSMQYKQTKKSLPEIARELNVDGIVEGTVQRSGDRVRINAQLIQGPTDKHLWANSYERDLRDVFVLEKDVTDDIARQVQVKAKTPDQATAAQPRPVNPKVFEAYLQGKYHLQKFSRGSGDDEKRKASEFFQQAIDADPDFAPAYVGLSDAHGGTLQGSTEDQVIDKKAAEKAVELDPTLSEAWQNLGEVRYASWDWRRAEESYRRAITLNPNNAGAHDDLSEILDDIGRLEEGWKESQIAQQLDPNHNHLYCALYHRGEYDRAIQFNLTMLESDPNSGYLHHQLYEAYAAKGMYKESVQHLEQVVILFGFPEEAPRLRRAFAASGYAGAMREWAKELEHLQATKQLFMPVNLAATYAALGDKDRAFFWLEEGYKRRGNYGAGVPLAELKVYRGLDPLRSDPRFADLLRRVGLPPDPILGTPVPRIESLAVLPLTNLSGDPAQEYFSDGMTDALITELAQVGSLKVISRTSSAQYKQTKKSLPEIARELNVDGIIEGTVQRSGDQVRITAQLIQGPTDQHLWASSYERDLRNVFALENDVAGDIARQVQAKLKTPDQATTAQPRPVNPKVLEAYLQGNYHLQKFSRGSGDDEKSKAWKFFQQAIDADPDFAPAYVGLSEAHKGTMQALTEDGVIARKAAEKAVELDPTLSEAWQNLGDVRVDSWEWRRAEEGYRRAITLNPNNALAHEDLGDLLDGTGRMEEGWKESQIAQQLDPNHDHLWYALYKRREYDRAINQLQTMLASDPNSGYLHHELYETYSAKGMYKEAVQQLEQTALLFGFPDEAPRLRRAFAASGYAGAMREWAQELERLCATNQVFMPVNLAATYAALGDKDRAFYWLEQGYKHRGQCNAGVDLAELRVYRGLDPLRSDPRFADLLRRMGLPP